MGDPGTVETCGDRGSWTFRNDGPRDVIVVFEPWADEITVRPGSTLVLRVSGGVEPPDHSPPIVVEPVTNADRVTVWANWPNGSGGSARLDGAEL